MTRGSFIKVCAAAMASLCLPKIPKTLSWIEELHRQNGLLLMEDMEKAFLFGPSAFG